MKHNIQIKLKIALLFLIPMLISSCEDWLELVPPDGLVRDEYWKTKEDVEASLMGAYLPGICQAGWDTIPHGRIKRGSDCF